MPRLKRSIPEINAGSMADIAFLLLIFFLVTTSIDSDKGIAIKLPPKFDKTQVLQKIKERNVFEVLINSQNQLLVEGNYMEVSELCQAAKAFIRNQEKNPAFSESPDKAIISLKNDVSTTYGAYLQVQNELKRAYNELRDEASRDKFGVAFDDLVKGSSREQEILSMYPQKISEAEPEDINKD
ncbi:MAG: ExbD/TolR family protein [Chitinophagaceae bacterium]